MKFICNNETFFLIDQATQVLSIEKPERGTFVDIADDRLIGIARLLGMEEMVHTPPQPSPFLRNGEGVGPAWADWFSDPDSLPSIGALPAFDPDHPLDEKVFEPTNTLPLPQSLPTPPQPSPFLRPHSLRSGAQSSRGEGGGGEKAVCEICGKPVVNKKKKTCSQECLAESRRRYNREYQRRLHEKVVSVRKDKKKVEAAGNESVPLSRPEQTT